MTDIRRLRREVQALPPFRPLVHGGHPQTILGHFWPYHGTKLPNAKRVELKVGPRDRIVGFLYELSRDNVVHVFHGLAGSSESKYMPRAARIALAQNYSVVLWNHRGCGVGEDLAIEPYHSGRSDDLARAVKWGRDTFGPHSKQGVIGYSLSGNAAALLAAGVVPSIDTSPLRTSVLERDVNGSLPDFAIAVNPPFDLKRASVRLRKGSVLYGQRFVLELRQALGARERWVPQNEREQTLRDLAIRARKRLHRLATVENFDAAYTGPAAGFRDGEDYYARASSGQYLKHVALPLVLLSADDDPITAGFKDLPEVPDATNPYIIVDRQEHGGHMGYIDAKTLRAFRGKSDRWLESRLGFYLMLLKN